MSVLRTCIQHGRSAIEYLAQTLCLPRPDPTFLWLGR